MGWSSTHQRAVRTTTELVVAICRQMEDWRRLLRHVERIDEQRRAEREPLIPRRRRRVA